jgi:16S rRNA (guanine527-N7)-methyltransferase
MTMPCPPLAENICTQLGVSRETSERLHRYVAVLLKWQAKINLISRTTVGDIWVRHILDSGQIHRHIPNPSDHILDIGSGAGLPGLVMAIMRQGEYGDQAHPVTLVESDQRKCAFLKVAAQECGVKIKIAHNRLEHLPPLYPDIITARALAPMGKLLVWTKAQHHDRLRCLFLKGGKVDEELTCLEDYPIISCAKLPSLSCADGVIVQLTGFTAAS